MTANAPLPARTTVAIIGGGPAGSMTASLLAREGIDAVVLERDTFPRYHIGESLLTSVRPMFDFVGLADKVERYGFTRKRGAYFRVKQGHRAGLIDFSRLSRYDHSYQVVRSEFDELLLNHAAECGAHVSQATRVTNVEWDGDRPVALAWTRADGATGRLAFDYLVDASGMQGFLASKYLKNRRFQSAFANVAVGRYWRDFRPFVDDDGVERVGYFNMEALPDGSGWAWAIPLHDGTLSLGIVVHVDTWRAKLAELGGPEAVYTALLAGCPDMVAMTTGATPDARTEVWQDYSYVAERFSGPNYRISGDAACFIDPFFSTGVHMAMLGALSGAASICSALRGEVPEDEAAAYHDKCVRSAYTRFTVAVAGVYRQIRNQTDVVLPDVDAASFQRVFDVLQPLITGNLDLNSSGISKEAVEASMDLMGNLIVDIHAGGVRSATADVSDVLSKHSDMEFKDTSRTGAIDGLYIRMEHGRLGLERLGFTGRLLNSAQKSVARTVIRGLAARTRPPEPA